MNRRIALAAVLALSLVAVVIAGCSGNQGGSYGGTSGGSNSAPSGKSTTGTTIIEKGLAFTPSTATVKVGDKVTFENQDSSTHDVFINGAQLGEQGPGESKTWTASNAGSFAYNCTLHPSMTGEITVK